MRTNIIIEYATRSIKDKELTAAIREKLKADGCNLTQAAELNIYYKPEEGRAYYVLDSSIKGYVDTKKEDK